MEWATHEHYCDRSAPPSPQGWDQSRKGSALRPKRDLRRLREEGKIAIVVAMWLPPSLSGNDKPTMMFTVEEMGLIHLDFYIVNTSTLARSIQALQCTI